MTAIPSQDSAETVRLTDSERARLYDASAGVWERWRLVAAVERILAARLATPAESGLRESLGRLAESLTLLGGRMVRAEDIAAELRAVLGDDGEAGK